MPRTEYRTEDGEKTYAEGQARFNEIDKNSDKEDYSLAKKRLADDLTFEKEFPGYLTTSAASRAKDIEYRVRKNLK